MSTARKLHHKAMDFVDRADRSLRLGRSDEAQRLMAIAFRYESRAAERLLYTFDAEPTRSVLNRSAAALALKCGKLEEADKHIVTGLNGNPPDDIADELRTLRARVQTALQEEEGISAYSEGSEPNRYVVISPAD